MKKMILMTVCAVALWTACNDNSEPKPEDSNDPRPLESIVVTPTSVTVKAGQTVKLTAVPAPPNANSAEKPFVWASDNPGVATVTAAGLVEGVSPGAAEITVSGRLNTGVSNVVPVTVTADNPTPISTIKIGGTSYKVESVNFTELSPGVRWHKFNVTEFPGKLIVNAVEVSLAQNRLEVCPAALVTTNTETPVSMYNRYVAANANPIVAINGDFYLNVNPTGHSQITNRPFGMEVSNGMMGRTPFRWTNGFVIRDNKPAYGQVSFSGTATKADGQTFTVAEVNGLAGEGQLVLFNELSNVYGVAGEAHAWSLYSSTMVRLSEPQGGWRVNSPMTFTVTGITSDATTQNFTGGAILVGNSAGSPDQTLTVSSKPDGPNHINWSDQGAYYDITTTGADPYCYLSGLNPSISNAATATFSFEYQSASDITDMQIFYGKPMADGDFSVSGQRLYNTGDLDANDDGKWRTFTIDLKPAINNFQWGYAGHTLRLDLGGVAGHHVYLRNMHITGSTAGTDSEAFLSSLAVGQQVSLRLNVSLNDVRQTDPEMNVVGFQTPVLQDGNSLSTLTSKEPCTVVGYSQDGQKIYLVVVDGRSTSSGGATSAQMGDILRALGARHAVNLDSGGSSCMVVNLEGTGFVANTPSDGWPRAVANGIVVVKN